MKEVIVSQWEENAQAYAELIDGRGTPHHRFILNPCVEELMGEVESQLVLDAGCGEGYLSRYYARKGAQVTAIDISPSLIEKAKENTNKDMDIDYRIDDICSLESVESGRYDKVLCNLVLLNVPCLEDALSGFNRILRTDGELVFSVVHPAFDFFGPGEWELSKKDPDTNRRKGLYFKVDNYFKETGYERYWKKRNGEKFPRPITFYHRTLSTYFEALRKTGFMVQNLREPIPTAKEQFFERERRIPFFLVIKAVKSF